MKNIYTVPQDNTLLLLDDEVAFLKRLDRTLSKCGFNTRMASNISEATSLAKTHKITHALIDLRLDDGNGLDFIPFLKKEHPDVRIVVLTGYGALATAVLAVKMGAIDYLPKSSASSDDIVHTLLEEDHEKHALPGQPMSPDRVKWEHIQRVYEQCDRNISETARQFGMHRRTLQRILAKHAPNQGENF